MKKKTNNKGFTLVELIIVVAIIAVLAAVLAPQYIRYVERSRQSNDLQIAASITRAATTSVSDPQNELPAGAVLQVTWTTQSNTAAPTIEITNATGSTVTASNAQLQAVLNDIGGVMGWTTAATDATPSVIAGANNAESAAGNAEDFIFTIDTADGNITVVDGAETTENEWVDVIGVNE